METTALQSGSYDKAQTRRMMIETVVKIGEIIAEESVMTTMAALVERVTVTTVMGMMGMMTTDRQPAVAE